MCVYVSACVCVCFCMVTLKVINPGTQNLNALYYIKNGSDMFDYRQYQIKVKFTAGLLSFLHLPKYKLSGHITLWHMEGY